MLPRDTPRGLSSTHLLPGFMEVFANGSFGDKIFPANEMRRFIKLQVGLSLTPEAAPGSVCGWGGNSQGQFQACRMDRKGGFAKVIEKKSVFLLLYVSNRWYHLNY